jgi:nucleoside-diphosphate kinase
MKHPKEEKTLIIIKPDAIQRSLLGEVVSRFERKGLKIIGSKMTRISDLTIEEHYAHHIDKPFFNSLKQHMQSAPVVLLVLSGINAIASVRLIVGPTKAYEADAGTIRGDMGLSGQANIVHASDSVKSAEIEIKRFFSDDELFDYIKPESKYLYFDSYYDSNNGDLSVE